MRVFKRLLFTLVTAVLAFASVPVAYAATIYSPTITGYYQATNEAMYSATSYTPGTVITGYIYGKLSFSVPPGGYMSGSASLSGLTVGDHIVVTYSLGIPGGDSTMENVAVVSPSQTINFGGYNQMISNVNGVIFYSSTGKQFAVNSITIDSQIPATPGSLSVSSVTSSGGVATWGSIQNATSYLVYLDGKQVATTTGASYTLSGLQGASNHYVQVASSNSAGTSNLSNPYSFTTAPNSPTGLNATNVNYNALTLNWTASGGATSYLVFMNGGEIGTSSGTSFNVTGLTGNTSYSFYVEAQGTNTSSPSPTYTVTTALPPMPTPTGVSNSGTPGGSGTITWTPGSGTPPGTTYTVSQNGTTVGTTTGTSLPVSNYDPNSVYTVTASAPGYATAQGSGGGVFGGSTPSWGMSPGDLLTNSMSLVASIGSILLLILVVMFGPQLVEFIKGIVRKKEGDSLVYEPITYEPDAYSYDAVSTEVTTDTTPRSQETAVISDATTSIETSITTTTQTQVISDIGTYKLKY